MNVLDVFSSLMCKYTLVHGAIKTYIEGMRKGDLTYRYPTYIFLFLMLGFALIEPLPNIVRIIAGILTVLTFATIAVLRKK